MRTLHFDEGELFFNGTTTTTYFPLLISYLLYILIFSGKGHFKIIDQLAVPLQFYILLSKCPVIHYLMKTAPNLCCFSARSLACHTSDSLQN